MRLQVVFEDVPWLLQKMWSSCAALNEMRMMKSKGRRLSALRLEIDSRSEVGGVV
jgi:hypothetical protein